MVHGVRCAVVASEQPVGHSTPRERLARSHSVRTEAALSYQAVPQHDHKHEQRHCVRQRHTYAHLCELARVPLHIRLCARGSARAWERAWERASTDQCREAIERVHEHQHNDKHAAHEHHRRKAALSVIVKSRAIKLTDLAKLKCRDLDALLFRTSRESMRSSMRDGLVQC